MTNPTSKVVLITGASSGIGEATARHLAAAGHQVVLGARRTDRLAALAEQIRAAGGLAEHHPLDVTSPASVRAFVDAAHAAHGRIDVLVNNAGVMPLSTLDALRIDEWNQMIDVNLRGTLHGIAAVLPLMRARRTGHIISGAPPPQRRLGKNPLLDLGIGVSDHVRLDPSGADRIDSDVWPKGERDRKSTRLNSSHT